MGSRAILAAAVARLSADGPPLTITLDLDYANRKLLFRIGHEDLQLEQPMELDEAESLATALTTGVAMLRKERSRG